MSSGLTALSSLDAKGRSVDLGERYLVLGVMLALAVEATLTILASGVGFTWSGLLVGIFSSLFVLFLACKLYGGEAKPLAIGWILLQAAVAVLALANPKGPGSFSSFIGQPVPWMSIMKLGTYALLAYLLLRSRHLNNYLANKRGETLLDIPTADEEVIPLGTPVPYTADQVQTIQGVASFMKVSAILLMIAGVTLALGALKTTGVAALLSGLQGVLLFFLGIFTLGPAAAVGIASQEQGTGPLVYALDKLNGLLRFQSLVSLFILATLVRTLLSIFVK